MTEYMPLLVKRDWNKASDREWADVLAGLPLFAGIAKRDLRRIVREADFAEFAPGDLVVSTAAPADHFYVILSGQARASGRQTARALRAGNYFGEMGVLDREPRSVSIVAMSDLHVMRLPRHVFDEALERHPSLARAFLTGLTSRVRELERDVRRVGGLTRRPDHGFVF
jgi:CRP/FNR family transcriptional regulator, cyclic AMP receptor protein